MFQQSVNIFPAVGIAGDFASTNPRATVDADAGGLVAGPGGVTVGKFAWVAADGKTVTSFGEAGVVPAGFIHREQQALIPNYLGEESMVIPQGFPVVLHSAGDFFAINAGPNAFTSGNTVYARYSDGAVMSTLPTGASATGSVGSTNTGAMGSTFTATAAGTALTTSAVTGIISIGDTISGTGVPAGTTILSQTSGTTGGAGVYVTSVATTAAAATVTSYGVTLKTTAATGLVSIGDIVAGGAGFPVGATILAQTAGTTGGAGTYTLSAPATAYVASATGVTTYGNVLNVTAVGSGVLAVGDAISGTGIPSGASIASLVSGVLSGACVVTMNIPATAYAASTTVTVVAGIATNFTATNASAVNAVGKISTWGA